MKIDTPLAAPTGTDTLKIDSTSTLFPIKPPQTFSYTLWEIAAIAVIFLLLASLLAGLGLWYYRRKPVPGQPVKRIGAAEQAMVKLRELEKVFAARNTDSGWYYEAVSAVVREFLMLHLGIDAQHQTTPQMLRALRSCNPDSNLLQETDSFFETADLVKFAGQRQSTVQGSTFGKTAATLISELDKLAVRH